MPGQSLRSRIGGAVAPTPAPRPVPLNGYYPKLLQGDSGSVWLVSAAKTGTIVHLSGRPQKSKHKVGYYSTRLDEGKMRVFAGDITIGA